MVDGIQSFMAAAGDSACYALCIVRIAEMENMRSIDPVQAMVDGISEKHISFDWENFSNGFNFFVAQPAGFLRMMTGGPWSVRHDGPKYQKKLGEYVVQRWERETTGKTFGHFRLPDWDSLIDSKTVQFGRIVSTRVFYQT